MTGALSCRGAWWWGCSPASRLIRRVRAWRSPRPPPRAERKREFRPGLATVECPPRKVSPRPAPTVCKAPNDPPRTTPLPLTATKSGGNTRRTTPTPRRFGQPSPATVKLVEARSWESSRGPQHHQGARIRLMACRPRLLSQPTRQQPPNRTQAARRAAASPHPSRNRTA